MKYDLSVIVLNYNFANGIVDCIHSILSSKTSYKYEVLFVDNGSTDNSVRLVREEFPSQIRIIENGANLGFGKGNNQGIKQMRGEYCMLLNPDARVSTDTIEVMMGFLKNRPDVGIATCKVLKQDGTPDLAARRNFPSLRGAIFRASGLSRVFLKSTFFNEYNIAGRSVDESQEIDQCNGAFLMISPACLAQVKGFDEDFFMYFEDSDLCMRAKMAGFKIWYHPETIVTHIKSPIASRNYRQATVWFHDSMWLFVRKHYKFGKIKKLLVYLGIRIRMYLLIVKKFIFKQAKVSK